VPRAARGRVLGAAGPASAAGRGSGHRQRLGAAGEARAAEWYRRAGYEVVARNWRCREGEIDLVVRNRATLVFCEVKTRSSDRFGLPVEAVTPAKQRRIRGLAARFLHDHDGPVPGIRFDVVSVMGDRVDVLEAAF
jgi:putative endonuclease